MIESSTLSSSNTSDTNSNWVVEPVQAGHPLQHQWAFWFLRRIQGLKSQESYEKNIKKIGTFSTVC